MRIHHYSLPIVLLVLIKYATTSSIVEGSNTRPAITQQQQLPTIPEPDEMMTENDGADDSDDFESSASELVQVHALPETLNSDDSKGGPENGAGFQRARRRRRRRRRKRPKTTASPGPDGPFAATSPGTAAPASFVGKAENDGLHLYYAVPEEEIRKKPFKYRPGVDDAFLPHVAAVYDEEGYTTPRRRVTKRRRRPFKKPTLSVDHHPSLVLGTNDDENGDSDNDTGSPSIPSVNEADSEDIIPTKGSNLFKQTITTSTTTATTAQPAFEQDDFHSTKSVSTTVPEDSDSSLKKRKTLAAAGADVAKKPQHPRNDAKDDRLDQKSEQHQPQPHNVQHNVVEQQSKLVENRKELFKMRRLPPTWAILGHPKHKASSSSSFFAATKNSTDTDNVSQIQSKPIGQVTAEADNSLVSASTPLTWSSTVSSTTARSNRVRESDDERVVSSTFKPKYKEAKESPTSTTEAILVEEELEGDEEPRQNQNRKQEPGNSADATATPYQFPIITYTGQKPIDSNTSAFLSSNEQRLAIIYVPCNQTADKIVPSGAGSAATFIHSAEQSIATKTSPSPLETTTRKISTTNLPDVGQSGQLDDSVSFGSKIHLENAKWSSTAKPTTSLWSPSPSLSTMAEKLSTDANVVLVTSTSTYTNREAKRYHDSGVPKAKSDSAKEEQISSLRSKPYGSAAPNSAFIKPFAGSSREIVISYTSTTNSPPSLFSYHNIDSADEQISLQLNNSNNSGLIYRKSHENRKHQQQHAERKKLPLAVKSAIIISGAVLALAVLGFFALLLSCKIRQAKSRMKCHRELYRDQFQSSEFRQSSRSTSPVMSKSNFNTRNLTNNIQPTNVVAGAGAAPNNRNYYLWQTLRKTFQYD